MKGHRMILPLLAAALITVFGVAASPSVKVIPRNNYTAIDLVMTPELAGRVIDDIHRLASVNDSINIVFDSPGGYSSTIIPIGLAIDQVKVRGTIVNCYLKDAASAAAVVITHCTNIYAMKDAGFMLHFAFYGMEGRIKIGKDDLSEMSRLLNETNVAMLIDLLSNIPIDEYALVHHMNMETEFTAESFNKLVGTKYFKIVDDWYIEGVPEAYKGKKSWR